MRRPQDTPDSYESLEVSEMFCSNCKRSQPVRQHLLLVLPTGNQYEFRCSVCAHSVGSKQDDDRSTFAETLRMS
jgi:hypothetical protein